MKFVRITVYLHKIKINKNKKNERVFHLSFKQRSTTVRLEPQVEYKEFNSRVGREQAWIHYIRAGVAALYLWTKRRKTSADTDKSQSSSKNNRL